MNRVLTARLARTQRLLWLLASVRALVFGALAGGGAWLVARVAGASVPATVAIAGLTAVAVSAIEIRRIGIPGLGLSRCALWVEEQVPAMRYALVSAHELPEPRSDLEQAIDRAAWVRAEHRAIVDTVRRIVPLVVAALATWWAAMTIPGRIGEGFRDIARSSRRPAGGPLRIRVVVSPPAYTGQQAVRLEDPTTIRAIVGSVLDLSSRDSGLRGRLGDRVLVATPGAPRQLQLVMPAESRALTVSAGAVDHIIALEGIADSAPAVTLDLPARDSVLREAGTVALRAHIADDFGSASGAFEYIVSSGEGESFTFRAGTVGAQALGLRRATELAATLDLSSLQLKPGDIVHLRAVARDGNTVTGPGIGRSETRAFRLARASEYDSLAVEGAVPPVADSSVLSQRMLINATQALQARRRSMSRDAFLSSAQSLARDQGRLRRQVGDLIFDRLDPTPAGEHAHDAELDRPMTKEDLLKAAEASTRADSEVLDFAHGESPVTNVNRPLLEAYNAMWDAGRELAIANVDGALPPMYRALAAIQRARAAERLYLRGKVPRIVVDIARIRLQGKDRGQSSQRVDRWPADSALSRARARFRGAVARFGADDVAAVDSLVMLRIELAGRAPVAARLLDGAITALRSGRDATDALVRVRRALDGAPSVLDSMPRWSRQGRP